ncbi:dimethyladenosine transferase 2, mitochondrial isoform X1 [Lemur catta]|uniref:dimethyladenosine transferase 2, mitochondrial isoform X1 n=1 Tax=Lemur catta TaxID=9447 RepID=UPI001E26B3AF|nr:dimethyladenosine transferase 2, mitochondrial isoform X1 [Lemur catta]
MWAPGLPPRLKLSALAGAGRFCIWGSGASTREHLPAKNHRGFSDSYPQLLPHPDFDESPSSASKGRSQAKRYVTNRRLAESVAEIVRGKLETPRHLLLECNPGPGILTQALLKTGAKVVALESDRKFIPHLESLGKNSHGRLEVIHCDFFKIDPRSGGLPRPPVMASRTLFQNLRIEARPWSGGIPLKVIGIFPFKNERRTLWKFLYDLYACTSIYKYGRVELNMFISEKEYKKLMANRNSSLYDVLSVLWQVACEIKILQVVPSSSFDVCTQKGQLEKAKHRESLEPIVQNVYFIQMTPRKNLFTENLTPINYDVFFHMIKHCFGKRGARLIDHLHCLTPIDAMDILMQIQKSEKVKVTNLCPQDFKRVFETIEGSKDYAHKWLYDDTMSETKQ